MTDYISALTDSVNITDVFSYKIAPVAVDLYSIDKPGQVADPAFSPDGTMVVYVEHLRAPYTICTLNVGATAIHEQLYADLYPIGDPTFSFDGFFILFSEQTVLPSVTYPYGQSRLRFMNADGTNVQTILDDGNANLHPCWATPTQVAFQWWQYGATPSEEFQISLIDLAGNGRHDLGPGEYPRVVEL